MGRPTQPKRVSQYSAEFKVSAVKLSRLPGVEVQHVAQALDIHPFMLSRWRKEYREGRLRAKTRKVVLSARLAAELKQLAELQRRYTLLKQEHELLKNRPRGLPRPICLETGGAYTDDTLGQWPLAFWRRMSPSKNLAQGKLRTQLWWHFT
jgi:transposase